MKLFIDDERDPVTSDWIVARSSAEAIALVEAHGMPNEIAFDHDLGGNDTSMTFIKWLEEKLLDGVYLFPSDFKYSVHSQNPVGVTNIEGKMDPLVFNFIYTF